MALFGGDSTAFNTPQNATFGSSGIGSPEQLALTIGNKNKLQNVTFAITDNGAIAKANEQTARLLDIVQQYGNSPATNFFNDALTWAMLAAAAYFLLRSS